MSGLRLSLGVASLLAVLFVPAAALAQEAKTTADTGLRKSVEVFGGGVFAALSLDSTATLRTDMSVSTLTLQARGVAGAEVAVNAFVLPRVGFQVRVEHASGRVGGPSRALTAHYPPRSYEAAWPDSNGRWTFSVYSVNAVVRGRFRKKAIWSASGGLSYASAGGDLGDFGIVRFASNPDRTIVMTVRADAHPTGVPGFNLGGDVAWPLSRGVSLVADARMVRTSQVQLRLFPSVTSMASGILDPAFVDLSQVRLLVGIRLRIWQASPKPATIDGWRRKSP